MDRSAILKLLSGSAALAFAVSGAAHAQAPSSGQSLEEVVVTATRQVDTVHSVPLTVSAITNRDVERQGIKVAEDLTQIVTSLRISSANSGGNGGVGGSITSNAQISIRGISSSVSGAAATTGIYLDDVPLQQRTPLGPTGGGTALPLLADLERVEVLKGPQGTLYGGSSEGGTLRFLTQQPSLTRNTLTMKAEGSSTDGGQGNYEFSGAASAPLVADKLAAHVSAYYRHDGGYIDHVSQYSGNVLAGGRDTNSSDHGAFHGLVLAKLTDRFSATFGLFYQKEAYRDSDNFWEKIPQYQATVGPFPVGTTYTYGPFTGFGPQKSGLNTNIGKNFYTSDSQISPLLTPHSQSLFLPSLTLDYAFDKVGIKSVTAFTETHNNSTSNTTYADITGRGSSIFVPPVAATVEGPFNALPNNSGYIANLPYYNANFNSSSITDNFSQEIRLSSITPESRFSWVAGAFYNYQNQKANGTITANLDDVTAAVLFGRSQRTGATIAFSAPGKLNESQVAAFGEVTFKITEQLRAIIGVRETQNRFTYSELTGGTLFGFPPGLLVVGAQGTLTSTATTPKFALQYVHDANTNFYASASQGFRPGGVNPALSPVCQTAAVAAGYTTGAPPTFNNDSLWSYEGGAKIRTWGGKATFNASVFYVDWQKVQTTIDLGCGGTFAINASSEVSQGVDLESSAILFPGFTATVHAGYTDAHFGGTVKSPAGTATLINSGDQVRYTPKWQVDLGGEYRFQALNRPAYIRADYSYQDRVYLGFGPGTLSYTPDNYTLPATNHVNARAGLTFGSFEAAAFVNNLTGSNDLLYRGGFSTGPGRYGCQNLSCTAYNKYSQGAIESSFRPRTIGVTFSYRH